jgi:hypothetical protein
MRAERYRFAVSSPSQRQLSTIPISKADSRLSATTGCMALRPHQPFRARHAALNTGYAFSLSFGMTQQALGAIIRSLRKPSARFWRARFSAAAP